jgi:hypothetical protein
MALDGLAPSLLHRRRVVKELITYVGLDVHKDTIAVALADEGKRGGSARTWHHCPHVGGIEQKGRE